MNLCSWLRNTNVIVYGTGTVVDDSKKGITSKNYKIKILIILLRKTDNCFTRIMKGGDIHINLHDVHRQIPPYVF